MFTFEMFFKQFGIYASIVNGYSSDNYHTTSNVRYPRIPAFVVHSDGSGHFTESRYNRIENKTNHDFQFGHFKNWKEAYDQITERIPEAKKSIEEENMME